MPSRKRNERKSDFFILSLLAGVLIFVLVDWVVRIVVIPAELPIGIVTSLLGAPVLFMLIQREAR